MTEFKSQTGFKKRLTDWAIDVKMNNLETYGNPKHSIYDSIIFNKARALLGGRVRTIFTGSAPISKDVISFLKIAFCV